MKSITYGVGSSPSSSPKHKEINEINNELNDQTYLLVNTNYDPLSIPITKHLYWELSKKNDDLHCSEIAINKCGIICCSTPKESSNKYFNKSYAKSLTYHTDLPSDQRQYSQMLCTTDKIKIAIAIGAFGIDINEYEVPFVIDTAKSNSVEYKPG